MYYELASKAYWSLSGASATSAIITGLDSAFATDAWYLQAAQFLTANQQVGGLTPLQIKNILTLILINIELSNNGL